MPMASKFELVPSFEGVGLLSSIVKHKHTSFVLESLGKKKIIVSPSTLTKEMLDLQSNIHTREGKKKKKKRKHLKRN